MISFEDGELVCPHCGGTHLHHDAVEVYFRQEDAAEGVAVTVNGWAHHNPVGNADVVGLNANQEGNPSPRRDGLVVHLWCEECGKHPLLHLVQHKGATLVDWATAESR